jgi:hypothetical protein
VVWYRLLHVANVDLPAGLHQLVGLHVPGPPNNPFPNGPPLVDHLPPGPPYIAN